MSGAPKATIVAARGEHEPVEHLEQRGLAGAVGADDGDVLAAADGRGRSPPAPWRRRGTRARRRARTKSVSFTARPPCRATTTATQSATLAAAHTQSRGRIRSLHERRHRAGEAAREHRVVDVVGRLHRLAHDEGHALRHPGAVLARRAARQRAALARQVDLLHGAQQREDLLLRHGQGGDHHVGHAHRAERPQQVGPAHRPDHEQGEAGRGDDARHQRRHPHEPGLGERQRSERTTTGSPGVKTSQGRRQRDEEREQAGRQPHLARERADADQRRRRQDHRQPDERDEQPHGVHEARGHGEEHQREQLDARVEALQQARPSRELLVLRARP